MQEAILSKAKHRDTHSTRGRKPKRELQPDASRNADAEGSAEAGGDESESPQPAQAAREAGGGVRRGRKVLKTEKPPRQLTVAPLDGWVWFPGEDVLFPAKAAAMATAAAAPPVMQRKTAALRNDEQRLERCGGVMLGVCLPCSLHGSVLDELSKRRKL